MQIKYFVTKTSIRQLFENWGTLTSLLDCVPVTILAVTPD